MTLPSPTPQQTSVLVVEDAPEFQHLLRSALEREGFDVQVAGDGDSALRAARASLPAVVLLDVGLPDIDGIEVCRVLRSFSDSYVIMVTNRDEEVDRLIGLAVGADDYIVKPFSTRELVARIRAMLRRPRISAAPTPAPAGEVAGPVVGDLSIDAEARAVRVGGAEIVLTKMEFDILVTLASRPTMVFTRELLIERVWGQDWYGDSHVIDVHIANLRRKIDIDGRNHIRTVRGVGYKIETPA